MTMLDTVIVGAGQAGLGVSYFLQQNGNKHIVFERGRIGESWISQRWDLFRLNTPNARNTLPGLPYDGPDADGFSPTDTLLNYFQGYVDRFQLPVRTGMTVISVERADDQESFIVKTRTDDRQEDPSRAVRWSSLAASSVYPGSLPCMQNFRGILPNTTAATTVIRRDYHRVRLSWWGVDNPAVRSPKTCWRLDGLCICARAKLGVSPVATGAWI